LDDPLLLERQDTLAVRVEAAFDFYPLGGSTSF
jgi:hypothetical protein